MTLRTCAIAFTALLTSAAATGCIISSDDDGDSTLTVSNDSSYTLVDLRITDIGSSDWGPNLLGDVLFPGEFVTVGNIECSTYDVLVTDETNVQCQLSSLDLCFDDAEWRVTDQVLDTCAFGP